MMPARVGGRTSPIGEPRIPRRRPPDPALILPPAGVGNSRRGRHVGSDIENFEKKGESLCRRPSEGDGTSGRGPRFPRESRPRRTGAGRRLPVGGFVGGPGPADGRGVKRSSLLRRGHRTLATPSHQFRHRIRPPGQDGSSSGSVLSEKGSSCCLHPRFDGRQPAFPRVGGAEDRDPHVRGSRSRATSRCSRTGPVRAPSR
jgi:hypothetical protein